METEQGLRRAIEQIEPVARRLEPTSDQRRKIQQKVIAYGEQFLDGIEDRKTYVAPSESDTHFVHEGISVSPAPIDRLLDELDRKLDNRGLNPAGGGHMGYIPGGGVYPSALGDYLADITNRYAGIYFANPGAVEMENMMIDWLAEAIGYPDDAVGNLTSGGSIANLTAIVTARDAAGLSSKDYQHACVYLTDHAHHCVGKALRIAGLADVKVVEIPTDERYRMDVGALQDHISQDRNAGLRPWLIVASAGTTDTGAVDPLDEIADVAENSGCWLHIDGAYGGLFNLVDELKPLLKGMERADSVVVDPHKTLFLPYGTGAVLVRDRKAVFQAHHYTANYMQDALNNQSRLSPADLSPELTKHFRGLRMWLPLKLLGTEPFVANLREKVLLARYFHQEVSKIEGVETGPQPDLSVVTFRYVPTAGDADEANRRIVEHIHEDGRVFLSSTMIDGVFTIRMAAVCFRTHLREVDLALEILEEAITALGKPESEMIR